MKRKILILMMFILVLGLFTGCMEANERVIENNSNYDNQQDIDSLHLEISNDDTNKMYAEYSFNLEDDKFVLEDDEVRYELSAEAFFDVMNMDFTEMNVSELLTELKNLFGEENYMFYIPFAMVIFENDMLQEDTNKKQIAERKEMFEELLSEIDKGMFKDINFTGESNGDKIMEIEDEVINMYASFRTKKHGNIGIAIYTSNVD